MGFKDAKLDTLIKQVPRQHQDFVRTVVAREVLAEREACAKVADELAEYPSSPMPSDNAANVGIYIRART